MSDSIRTLFDRLKRSMATPFGLFTLREASALLGESEISVQASARLGEIRGFIEVDRAHGVYRSAHAVDHGEQATHFQARELANAMARDCSQLGRYELRMGVVPGAEGSGSWSGAQPSSAGDATLYGHFAVFNQWTEIDSPREGRFLEQVAPGAFARTIAEDRASMRILLNHGHDVAVGNLPIAAITQLREDSVGGYYEGKLLDGVPPLVLSGLRAGQFGSSFRFNVRREQLVERPTRSTRNPLGLPERTVQDAQVAELGPVTWPAYRTATAGARTSAPATYTPQAPRFKNDEEWMTWLRR
jgi:HK97 family phage prohead protease